MSFKDHFSGHADDYARHRPEYPPDLYEFLARALKRREVAWDCGTGNGQAALGLARYFERVIATDPSAEQIRHAFRHEKIHYAVAPAEETEIPSATVDLITVAQAAHWFDLDRFYREARRVLRPSGALALWCYGLNRVTPAIDRVVHHYYANVVGPYWPPERRFIDEKYASLPFPFAQMPAPDLHMKVEWDLNEFLGYLRTWSATRRYQAQNEQDPLDTVRRSLTKAWGDPQLRHIVRWPLHIRFGKAAPI